MNKGLVASIIALTMGLGGAVAAAQSQSVGDAMKNAGRATVIAGKTVTHSVTHTTKKVVGTTGTQTKHRTTVTKTVRPTRTVAGTSGTAPRKSVTVTKTVHPSSTVVGTSGRVTTRKTITK